MYTNEWLYNSKAKIISKTYFYCIVMYIVAMIESFLLIFQFQKSMQDNNQCNKMINTIGTLEKFNLIITNITYI